jgi:hypothetical protein
MLQPCVAPKLLRLAVPEAAYTHFIWPRSSGDMLSLKHRNIFLTCSALLFVFFTASYLGGANSYPNRILSETPPPAPAHKIKYKPPPPPKSYPIVDNFPLAAAAHSAADLPPIAEWNRPPSTHVPEQTPLFIGFTRNWRILQQVVVSYITAGWPPSDIYVIENTGVMDSNKRGLLSLQNPFFLNHTRLNMLGVNIIVTPTLLTFAQLQNFYLHTSIEHEWPHYFWSHMDVGIRESHFPQIPHDRLYLAAQSKAPHSYVSLFLRHQISYILQANITDSKHQVVAASYEKDYVAQKAQAHETILPPSDPKHDYTDFASLYKNCVLELRNATLPSPKTGKVPRWAMRFFSYDRLALVNVAAFVEVGGWDTLIPFYHTDCDMHARLEMVDFEIKDANPGYVFDVAASLEDLIVLYRKKGVVDASFQDPGKVEEELKAKAEAEKMQDVKKAERRAVQLDGNSEASKEFVTDQMVKEGRWEDDEIYSERWLQLERTLDDMLRSKGAQSGGRNTWQFRQTGGQGDPFYRDSLGFEEGIRMTIEHGRRVFAEKWGHRDCDIVKMGLRPGDAWKVEHDWDD